MRGIALLVAASLLCAQAAAADDTVEVAAGDGTVTVQIPAEWKTEKRPSKTFALSVIVTAPDVARPFVLSVYVLPRGRRPRTQMQAERSVHRARYECAEEDVVSAIDPLPHTALTWTRRGETNVVFFAYVLRKRRCFTLVVDELESSAYPALKERLLTIAQSIATTLPQLPPDPEGYTEKSDRGIRLFVHSDVSARDLSAVRKLLSGLRKDFESRHGALTIAADNAPMVVVHAASGAARGLCEAAAEAPAGQYYDSATQCLYLVPPVDVRSEAFLCGAAVGFLHIEAHGYGSYWLMDGERRAAFAQVLTRKRLPALPSELGPLPTKLPPFDKQLSGVGESLYWVLFFRYGPAKYRKAFDVFMDDLRETDDEAGALERHLLSLDQAEMQAAADAFVAKKVKLVDVE